jgi:hypothetical protein
MRSRGGGYVGVNELERWVNNWGQVTPNGVLIDRVLRHSVAPCIAVTAHVPSPHTEDHHETRMGQQGRHNHAGRRIVPRRFWLGGHTRRRHRSASARRCTCKRRADLGQEPTERLTLYRLGGLWRCGTTTLGWCGRRRPILLSGVGAIRPSIVSTRMLVGREVGGCRRWRSW